MERGHRAVVFNAASMHHDLLWPFWANNQTRRVHLQSRGSRYPGVPPNRPPKAWASSTVMSHEVHESDVILMVTSSKDANTSPTRGSVIAAALIYRLCMRRFISADCSPEISSALPAPLTPRSAPGFRTSTISDAFALAAIFRAFRLLEEVAMNKW